MSNVLTEFGTAPDDLGGMSDEDFRKLVDRDVRADRVPALRAEANVSRWHACLAAMKTNVEAQLASRGAEHRAEMKEITAKGQAKSVGSLEASAKFDRWRAGALRFKFGLEERLLEARSVRDKLMPHAIADVVRQERNEAFRRAFELETDNDRLREAIVRHRDHRCGKDCGDGYCVMDQELWSLVADD